MVGDLLQPTHLLFVLVVALLVLGPKRLPEVGRALGRGLRDFRSAISGEEPTERTISPAEAPEATPTATPVRPPDGAQEPSGSATAAPSQTEVQPEAPTETAEAVTPAAASSSTKHDSAA